MHREKCNIEVKLLDFEGNHWFDKHRIRELQEKVTSLEATPYSENQQMSSQSNQKQSPTPSKAGIPEESDPERFNQEPEPDIETLYAYELEAATIVQPEQVVKAVKDMVPQYALA